MIRSVRLDRLPDGLVFPAELAARISFANDSHELRFDGFMSKTDFDKLLRLHNDLAYQRALEQLFQKCTFRNTAAEADAKTSPINKAYIGVGASVAVVAVASILLVWNLGGNSPSQTQTGTVPIPYASKTSATEINPVNHVAHQSGDRDPQTFDGEIKP
jgi:hypothetical protein